MLYLLGYDLLTGVVVLTPLALLDGRRGVTFGGMMRNWVLVFLGNFAGALTVAVMMAIVFTFGFATDPSPVGKLIAGIGEARTLDLERDPDLGRQYRRRHRLHGADALLDPRAPGLDSRSGGRGGRVEWGGGTLPDTDDRQKPDA